MSPFSHSFFLRTSVISFIHSATSVYRLINRLFVKVPHIPAFPSRTSTVNGKTTQKNMRLILQRITSIPVDHEVLRQHTMLLFLLLLTKVRCPLTTGVTKFNHDREQT